MSLSCIPGNGGAALFERFAHGQAPDSGEDSGNTVVPAAMEVPVEAFSAPANENVLERLALLPEEQAKLRQEMHLDHMRQEGKKLKRKARKSSGPPRALYGSSSTRISSYANPQRIYALAMPKRSPPNAPRPAGAPVQHQYQPHTDTRAQGASGRLYPGNLYSAYSSTAPVAEERSRDQSMAGGLGEGFEHLLDLHNSLMTDALSKFDWAGSQSAQRFADSKHQKSAEMVNMDIRQLEAMMKQEQALLHLAAQRANTRHVGQPSVQSTLDQPGIVASAPETPSTNANSSTAAASQLPSWCSSRMSGYAGVNHGGLDKEEKSSHLTGVHINEQDGSGMMLRGYQEGAGVLETRAPDKQTPGDGCREKLHLSTNFHEPGGCHSEATIGRNSSIDTEASLDKAQADKAQALEKDMTPEIEKMVAIEVAPSTRNNHEVRPAPLVSANTNGAFDGLENGGAYVGHGATLSSAIRMQCSGMSQDGTSLAGQQVQATSSTPSAVFCDSSSLEGGGKEESDVPGSTAANRREEELTAALREHADILRDHQAKLLHAESQGQEEKQALSLHIQQLDARLASSNLQLANADKGYKAAQAQVRLLQSKVAMLQQDLSHERRLAQEEAQEEHDRQMAAWRTREVELNRALKEAQAQRQAAQAEVDAVRESLRETQAAVDSTRAVLQQQSEDHAKVVKGLHLQLLQAQEREKGSKEAAAALTASTQELESTLAALRLDYALREEDLMKRLRAEQQEKALHESGSEEDLRVKIMHLEGQVARLKKQQDDGRSYPAADESHTTDATHVHTGRSCPLSSSAQAHIDLPLDADVGVPHAGFTCTQEQQSERHENAHTASEQRYDQRPESANVLQEHSKLPGSGTKATHKAVSSHNAILEVVEPASASVQVQQHQQSAGSATEQDKREIRQLADLRSQLAQYKEAAKRLQHENHLLKQQRLLVNQKNASNTSASSVDAGGNAAGSSDGGAPGVSLTTLSQGDGARDGGNGGRRMRVERVLIPAHKRAEAAAAAEAAALVAAIRATPCKPRPPKLMPQPHPRPQHPTNTTKDTLADRPPWMGLKQKRVAKKTVSRLSSGSLPAPLGQEQSKEMGTSDGKGEAFVPAALVAQTKMQQASSKAPASSSLAHPATVESKNSGVPAATNSAGGKTTSNQCGAKISGMAWLDDDSDDSPCKQDVDALSKLTPQTLNVSTSISEPSNLEALNLKDPRVDAMHAPAAPEQARPAFDLSNSDDSLDSHSDDRPTSPVVRPSMPVPDPQNQALHEPGTDEDQILEQEEAHSQAQDEAEVEGDGAGGNLVEYAGTSDSLSDTDSDADSDADSDLPLPPP